MVLLLDGGLASTLELDGHEVDGHPLWSAQVLHDQPNAIRSVHDRFVEAGADIVITSSYQANVSNLMYHLGIGTEEAFSLIHRSVDLARCSADKATGRDVLVAGSVGSYGACLADGSEYSGAYLDTISSAELKQWHRPRIEALVAAGVDLLAVETLPGLREALPIIQLIREHPNQRFWVSFVCQNSSRTCDGGLLSQAAAAVVTAGGDQLAAVGVNCCSPQLVGPLLRSLDHRRAETQLVAYPNSGETWTGARWSGGSTVSTLSSYVSEWLSIGVSYLGGCCRVGPDQTLQMRHAIDAVGR